MSTGQNQQGLAARLERRSARSLTRTPIHCGVVQWQRRPALDRETKVRILPPQFDFCLSWLPSYAGLVMRVLGLPLDSPQTIMSRALPDLGAIAPIARTARAQLALLLE